MDRVAFREKIQQYCRDVGQSQKALAYALGLHYSVLSNKLNGTRNASLVLSEIKALIRTLVEWQAIQTQDEVVALLDYLDLKYNYFSAQEWAAAPLSRLEPLKPTPTKNGNYAYNFAKEATGVELAAPIAIQAAPPALESTSVAFSHNMLAQVTPLVGREAELEALAGILQRADVRLVTLTGPGGVGKTRLALGTAAGLVERFNDGVWLVGLAAVADPTLVPSAIAHALGIKENIKQSTLKNLKQYLSSKNLLLILDNFEQITPAAILVDELLRSAPGLKILVTSRTILHLYGECEFIVPSLSLPPSLNPARLSAYAITDLPNVSEAIALFVQRARAVKYDFKLDKANALAVIEICCYLEGLPLALELAAARLKLFSVTQLLQQLTTSVVNPNRQSSLELLAGNSPNLPLRHRTIRNTLDWSYQLLKPQEQRLLRQLAVFAGSFTIEAVAKVCFEGELPEFEVLERLGPLIDQSLLVRRPVVEAAESVEGEIRFGLLAVVREYLWEKLVTAHELTALQPKQAAYFINLIELAVPEFEGMRQTAIFKQIESNLENYNVVLNWLVQQKDWQGFGRLLLAFWHFWNTGSYLNEAATWLDLVLDHTESLSKGMLGQLLRIRANIYWLQGAFAQSQAIDEKSLAIWRELGDKLEIAKTLGNMGINLHNQGDDTQAIVLYQESLQLYRALGKQSYSAATLNSLGVVMLNMGRLETAHEYFNQTLEIHQQSEDKISIAGAFINLGNVNLQRGFLPQAESFYQQSLTLFRETKTKRGIAMALRNLAFVQYQYQDFVGAYTLYLESLSLRWEISDKIGTASSLEGLASVAVANQQWQQAVELYAVADHIRQQLNAPLGTFEKKFHDRNLSQLRIELGDAAFNSLWETGSALSLEKTVITQLEH